MGHEREGHEFQSCRQSRQINSGFQPLGECERAGNTFDTINQGFRIVLVPILVAFFCMIHALAVAQEGPLDKSQPKDITVD